MSPSLDINIIKNKAFKKILARDSFQVLFKILEDIIHAQTKNAQIKHEKLDHPNPRNTTLAMCNIR